MRPLLAGILLAVALSAAPSHAGYFDGRPAPLVTDETFTADEYIRNQARFWYEVYVNLGEDEGLLHDPFNPDLVFRKVTVGEDAGRAGRKAVEAQVKALQGEIRAMAAKDTAAYTDKERQLRAQFPAYWDSTAITLCADRLRFQRGLKTKFKQGLERSFRYLPLIDSVMAARNVPARLKFLPHVESSFYPHAYSKVGAAGMWQFMKSSARRYSMKVGYLVDERRDPVASTEAASRMLAYNYALLKSWPLAIVAYNHGPGGLTRAVQGAGTTDLSTIIKSYYSNSFGFASKNFYAEFLAASSIALKADSLYPDLRKLEPLHFQTLVLGKACGTRALCQLTGLSAEELEEYNLALRPATFRGNTQLPKGLAVKLPINLDVASVSSKLGAGEAALAALAAAATPVRPKIRPALPPDSTAVAVAGQDLRKAKPAKAKPGEAGPPAVSIAEAKTPEMRPAGPVAQVTPELLPGKEKPESSAAPRKDTATMAQVLAAAQKPAAAPAKTPKTPAPAIAPVIAPLASQPPVVQPVAVAAQPAPVAPPVVVDSTFALQASDLDKLAHPMDRFNPAIYNLEYEYDGRYLVIRAGTEETLSHYAEWAWIPERTLLGLNHLRSSRGMRIGQHVKIPMPKDKVADFVKKREEYYRAMEEDFYGSYYVSSLEPLIVSKGLNLWSWAQEKEIPFWLLQKHNPGKVLSALMPGDSLNVPQIETGIRKWGFTRYGNSKEYLAGIAKYIATE